VPRNSIQLFDAILAIMVNNSYNSVIQTNYIETIITYLPSENGPVLWKYSRYFDNPQFWSNPGNEVDVMPEFGRRFKAWANIKAEVCTTFKKTQPVPEEYELYNLTEDPLEEITVCRVFDNFYIINKKFFHLSI
jgi:hypothetical protein